MYDKRRTDFFPPVHAALLLLLAIVCVRPMLSWLYGVLFPIGIGENLYYMISALQEINLFALPAIWMLFVRYPTSHLSVRTAKLRASEAVSFSLAAILGVFVFSYLSNLWMLLLQRLGVPLTLSSVPAPSGPVQFLSSVLAIATLPAMCEELFFRGFVFSAFEEGGTRRALLWSALLFALMHGQLTALPVHLILGFLFGYMAIYMHSIYAPMLYHAFHNGASLLATYLLSQGAQAEAEADAVVSLSQTLSLLPSMLFLLFLWLLLIVLPLRARYQDLKGRFDFYLVPTQTAPRPVHERCLLAAAVALLVATYIFNTWGGLFL